jgi:hypothetical protein
VHQDPPDADDVGRCSDAKGAVAEERSADPFSAIARVDGEPAENRDWHRVGHVAADPVGGGGDIHRSGRQGIIARDVGLLLGDKGSRRAARLICQRPPLQPLIEGIHAAREILQLVVCV